MLILAVTHAVKKSFEKGNFAYHFGKGGNISFLLVLYFNILPLIYTFKKTNIFLFLYIEKTSFFFFFLICHCTKRATDNKINPQVKKISK